MKLPFFQFFSHFLLYNIASKNSRCRPTTTTSSYTSDVADDSFLLLLLLLLLLLFPLLLLLLLLLEEEEEQQQLRIKGREQEQKIARKNLPSGVAIVLRFRETIRKLKRPNDGCNITYATMSRDTCHIPDVLQRIDAMTSKRCVDKKAIVYNMP